MTDEAHNRVTTDDGIEILTTPSRLLWQLINDPLYGGRVFLGELTERERLAYGLGRLSTALHIETQARIVEAMGEMSLVVTNKETVASALRAVCRSVQLDDDALDWYDVLIEYATLQGGASPDDAPDAGEQDHQRSHDPPPGSERSEREDTQSPFDSPRP